ncbi:hypothetical protein [Gardnerella pickettii]
MAAWWLGGKSQVAGRKSQAFSSKTQSVGRKSPCKTLKQIS